MVRRCIWAVLSDRCAERWACAQREVWVRMVRVARCDAVPCFFVPPPDQCLPLLVGVWVLEAAGVCVIGVCVEAGVPKDDVAVPMAACFAAVAAFDGADGCPTGGWFAIRCRIKAPLVAQL
jgi:hypothetical protein